MRIAPRARAWNIGRALAGSVILALLILSPSRGDIPAHIRWNARFQESYLSHADGNRVPFEVLSPPEVSDLDVYPLLVQLKGGPRVSPNGDFPFFRVIPSRGHIWGYRALSAYDVRQVITWMKRCYPIDPDRVYLVGSSAGASGAMHLASCYPDEFAAVLALVAGGNNYPLPNFRQLPVAFHHGDRDWTSSICNVRVQVQKMRSLGCPVVLQEYPGAGHSVPRPHQPMVRWLLQQRRDPAPNSVSLRCETPALGRSYWIRIREFADPHQVASLDARIDDEGTVHLQAENVLAFSIDLTRLPDIRLLQAGPDGLSLDPAAGRVHFRFEDGRWVRSADGRDSAPAKRPYEAGGAANLYQGEPLLIVYGTGNADPDHSSYLQRAAQNLAACGGPPNGTLRRRFPVLADRDLTSEQAAHSNLILVGGPESNRLIGDLLPKLPVSLAGKTLTAGERPPLSLNGQILSLLHPHPDHPERLLYLITPFLDPEDLDRFAESPQWFLAGGNGFDRISQPDLVVQNLDRETARQMQFDKDWNWIAYPGAQRLIPPAFRDRSVLARTYLRLMRDRSGADYGLWWGPADQGMWGTDFNFLRRYQPAHFTEADLATQRRRVETMAATITRDELGDLWNRWGENRELLIDPQPAAVDLEGSELVRVHLPMDLYIKLGQRRRNLGAPEEGPEVSARDVRESIFP